MDLLEHFLSYSRGFLVGDREEDCSIQLKIDHTLQVVAEAKSIGLEDDFSPEECRMLEVAALFHDYGRFEQYRKFRTFRDRDSVDHGDLSAKLVVDHGILQDDFTAEERGIIIAAVRWHNKLVLPNGLQGSALRVAGAVRDADKLDIMVRLLEHFANPVNGDVVWGMAESESLSDDVATLLLNKVTVNNNMLRSVADFGASKFNWVYDLSSNSAKRKYLRSKFLDDLRSYLPDDPRIDQIHQNAIDFLQA